MQYVEVIDDDRKTITARIQGDTTEMQLASEARETRLRAKELHYGIVFDFRLTNLRITVTQVYYWIEKHYDGVDPDLKHIPVAYLIRWRDQQLFDFIETRFHNTGATVQQFEDETVAVAWLQSLLQG